MKSTIRSMIVWPPIWSPQRDLLMLLLLYGLLVTAKMAWVQGTASPLLFGDEYLYKSVSVSLFSGSGYQVDGQPFVLYPPLYPVALTPAFLFGADWYDWILRLNVLISSAILFPVWGIARSVLPRRESWLCVLVAAVIPFHVTFPRLVMSENLFLPLFLSAVYMLLAPATRREGRWFCLTMGAVWGLCYLTRHIFFASLPVLAVAMWLRPWLMEGVEFRSLFTRSRLAAAAHILAGFALVYGSWLFYATVVLGQSPLAASGLNLIPSQGQQVWGNRPRPLDALVPWTSAYVAYVVLLAAPYLPLGFWFALAQQRRQNRNGTFLGLLLVGLIGSLVAIATLLTWAKAGDAWTGPQAHIRGRHFSAIVPLLPLFGFLVLRHLQAIPFRLGRASMMGVAAAGLLIGAAYLLIISKTVWTQSPHLDSVFNCPDVSPYFGGWATFGSLLLVWALFMLVSQTVAVVFGGRLAAYIILAGWLAFYGISDRYVARIDAAQANNRHGRVLAQLIAGQGGESGALTVTNVRLGAEISSSECDISWTMAFFGVPFNRFTVNEFAPRHLVQPGYWVTGLASEQAAASYSIGSRQYYIYRLPLSDVQLSDPLSDNLLVNPGFEDFADGQWPVGWGAIGAPLVDRSGAFARSGQVAVRAGPGGSLVQQFDVRPGQLYSLGHWTRAEGPGQSARLQINWHDGEGHLVDVTIKVVNVETEWRQHSVQVMAPEGVLYAVVYASVQSESEVWFDDLWLVEGFAAPEADPEELVP